MGATSITSNSHWYSVPSSTPTAFSSQLKSSFKRPSLGFNSGGYISFGVLHTIFSLLHSLYLWYSYFTGAELFGRRLTQSWCTAINGRGRGNVSAWDDEPYEVLLGGKKSYLDEQDVVSFLDPPRELIPLDSASYNPAAYLWL